jgi:uncharacterized protein YbjQ (UPF0145 family)
MTSISTPATWLAGCIPDIPTPFDDNGALDLAAFAGLCERQIRAGVSAILVSETGGEASTLTPAEQESIIRTAVEVAQGRVRVIAGAGSNSTRQAIELTQRAEAVGADAVLSVVPYYNKPMQAGIHAHFRAIAISTALPIILHDVPSRTMRELSDDTLLQLADSRHFIGLKDGSGDITRLLRWLHFRCLERRTGAVPDDLFEFEDGASADRQIPAEPAGAIDGGPHTREPGRVEIRALPARLHVPGHPPAHRRTGRRRKSGGRKRDRRDQR